MAGFVSHRYRKSLDDSREHVKYIAFRSRELATDRGGAFDAQRDNADVKAFLDNLDDKKTRHSSVAVSHSLLFSMSGWEWEKSHFERGDYQEMIRNIMKNYELDTGRKLEWIAAEHWHETHPHVHVVVKAVYQDRDGVQKRLNFSEEDRAKFKELFQEEKNRLRGFDLDKELEREREERRLEWERQQKEKTRNDYIDVLLSELKRNMEQELQREEYRRQMAKNQIDRSR
ncbi:hypothetical protein WD019_19145 [Fictibacillus sp. Mic-4]|uniref:hypothetical protein n=1 Tax=Fictibacillus TaxID=1329200 RepID=UPI0003F8D918|nr:hypothetical protein [Fictibacillus gelatini]HAJ3957200.1 hypothetical protein [Escherichia coli]